MRHWKMHQEIQKQEVGAFEGQTNSKAVKGLLSAVE